MTKPAFSPTKVMSLRPLKDTVLVTDMQFKERKLNSGIVLLNDNGTTAGIRPRWGRIYAVGPDQKEYSVGQWICVAHGRWTRGVDIEDGEVKRTIRKIDPKDILISADERPNDLTFSDAIHIEKKQR